MRTIALVFMLSWCIVSHSQIGALDQSFGTGGLVSIDPGSFNETIIKLLLRANGGFYAVARTENAPAIMVGALGDDGSVDSSYGVNGFWHTDLGLIQCRPTSAAIDGLGRILVIGNFGSWPTNGFLACFNEEGDLDPGFNSGEPILLPSQTLYSILIEEGKIFIGGGQEGQGMIMRLEENGDLDTNYADEGIALFKFVDGDSEVRNMEVTSDGDLIVIGRRGGAIGIAKLSANGTLDNGFGINGSNYFEFNTHPCEPYALAVREDGKIYFAGRRFQGFPINAIVGRYTVDGQLDTEFNGTGYFTQNLSIIPYIGDGWDWFNEVILLDDGRVICIGFAATTVTHEFILAMFNDNGSLDQTFGEGGVVWTNLVGDSRAFAAMITPAGKLLTGGGVPFKLAQYHLEDISTDIGDPNMPTPITIFPNPASDYILLFIPESVPGSLLFKILSITGQVVKQERVTPGTSMIQLPEVVNGLYSYRFVDDLSNEMGRGKLLIHK